jgi:hypothetical protein
MTAGNVVWRRQVRLQEPGHPGHQWMCDDLAHGRRESYYLSDQVWSAGSGSAGQGPAEAMSNQAHSLAGDVSRGFCRLKQAGKTYVRAIDITGDS